MVWNFEELEQHLLANAIHLGDTEILNMPSQERREMIKSFIKDFDFLQNIQKEEK